MQTNGSTPIDKHVPAFNLKAVVQETGLKQDTLRAWERRYGLPNPERTSGGHRLYSQRDIEILKWLVERQKEGLSISRAVGLWRKLVAEGQDPLYNPEASVAMTDATPNAAVVSGDTVKALRDKWIEACMIFDQKTAEQILTQAAALYSPEIVCFELLQKGLAEIGQKWLNQETTVQQEHFASALAIRRIEALIAAAPNPVRSGRILVGCPPEEMHVFSLLLVTFLLRRNGWDTIFLGANVPISHLKETIAAVKPDLVILAAQQIHTAATLFETAKVLVQAGVPVAYGGLIFNAIPEIKQRIPGHFLGTDLSRTPVTVQKTLTERPDVPNAKPVSSNYKKALPHFRERQSFIETHIWETFNTDDVPQVVLAYWNLNVARNIIGALTLGNMDFLDHNLEWAEEMLINHHLPDAFLHRYLATYHQAAKENLNGAGQPVLDWLSQTLNN